MEKERLTQEKENLRDKFKEIEQKAFTVQENYKKTQEVRRYHVFISFGLCIRQVKQKNHLHLTSIVLVCVV